MVESREEIKLDELVHRLLRVSDIRTITELAQKLGIARATLNNWTQKKVSKMQPDSTRKIERALKENPQWGVKLGTVKNSTIEIITSGRDTSQSTNKPDDNYLLKKTLTENFQLKEEISILKEKLQKYEVKK